MSQKSTITITDDEEGGISVKVEFDPPIDADNTSSGGVQIALRAMGHINSLCDRINSISGLAKDVERAPSTTGSC